MPPLGHAQGERFYWIQKLCSTPMCHEVDAGMDYMDQSNKNNESILYWIIELGSKHVFVLGWLITVYNRLLF